MKMLVLRLTGADLTYSSIFNPETEASEEDERGGGQEKRRIETSSNDLHFYY